MLGLLLFSTFIVSGYLRFNWSQREYNLSGVNLANLGGWMGRVGGYHPIPLGLPIQEIQWAPSPNLWTYVHWNCLLSFSVSSLWERHLMFVIQKGTARSTVFIMINPASILSDILNYRILETLLRIFKLPFISFVKIGIETSSLDTGITWSVLKTVSPSILQNTEAQRAIFYMVTLEQTYLFLVRWLRCSGIVRKNEISTRFSIIPSPQLCGLELFSFPWWTKSLGNGKTAKPPWVDKTRRGTSLAQWISTQYPDVCSQILVSAGYEHLGNFTATFGALRALFQMTHEIKGPVLSVYTAFSKYFFLTDN